MNHNLERRPEDREERNDADERWLRVLLAEGAAHASPGEVPHQAVVRRGRATRRRRYAGAVLAAAVVVPAGVLGVSMGLPGLDGNGTSQTVGPAAASTASPSAAPAAPRDMRSADPKAEPPADAKRFEIATGTMSGQAWSLVYYPQSQAPEPIVPRGTTPDGSSPLPARGFCGEGFLVFVGGHLDNRAGGGCASTYTGPSVTEPETFSMQVGGTSLSSSGTGVLGTIVGGRTPATVTTVLAVPDGGGAPARTQVRTAADGTRYFVLAFDRGKIAPTGTLKFLDGRGTTLFEVPNVALGRAQ